MSDLEDDLELLADGYGHITAESKTRNALVEDGPLAFLITPTLGDGVLMLEIRAYVNEALQEQSDGTALVALTLRLDSN